MIDYIGLRKRPAFESMVFSRTGIEAQHLRQLDHDKRITKAQQSKAKSLTLRRKWMERQVNANYRNEYDRIQGELSHNKLSSVDRKRLSEREETLYKLFSRDSVYSK